MTVEIDTLPPQEWQAYKDLRLEALKTEPQAFGTTYQESLRHPDAYWKARLKDAADSNQSWLLFATINGVLAGMIGAFAENKIAEVISVYVAEAVRGQGVSKRLLSALLTELAASGSVETARLTVNKDQLPALALYRRFGFEIVREEECLMGDGKLYAQYVMERPL